MGKTDGDKHKIRRSSDVTAKRWIFKASSELKHEVPRLEQPTSEERSPT
jgi:hypothetical protein